MLQELIKDSKKPILIGTWKAADWAIRFYGKHGFCLVDEEEKNRLLKKYWAIPDRQVETSVVLVNAKYKELEILASGFNLKQSKSGLMIRCSQ